MQKLNKIISGDVFSNDYWSQLKKNLTEIMADPDEELTVIATYYICMNHPHYIFFKLHINISYVLHLLCGSKLYS